MNLHQRECIAGALGRVEAARLAISAACTESGGPQGKLLAEAQIALSYAVVDLRSLAREAREEMRAAETEAP